MGLLAKPGKQQDQGVGRNIVWLLIFLVGGQGAMVQKRSGDGLELAPLVVCFYLTV